MADAKDIRDAAEAILSAGKRPTGRSVRAWLVERDGSAPSYRDIVPVLRAWREKRRASRRVRKLLAAYDALDPEERRAFRDRAGLTKRAPHG